MKDEEQINILLASQRTALLGEIREKVRKLAEPQPSKYTAWAYHKNKVYSQAIADVLSLLQSPTLSNPKQE